MNMSRVRKCILKVTLRLTVGIYIFNKVIEIVKCGTLNSGNMQDYCTDVHGSNPSSSLMIAHMAYYFINFNKNNIIKIL